VDERKALWAEFHGKLIRITPRNDFYRADQRLMIHGSCYFEIKFVSRIIIIPEG